MPFHRDRADSRTLRQQMYAEAIARKKMADRFNGRALTRFRRAGKFHDERARGKLQERTKVSGSPFEIANQRVEIAVSSHGESIEPDSQDTARRVRLRTHDTNRAASRPPDWC